MMRGVPDASVGWEGSVTMTQRAPEGLARQLVSCREIIVSKAEEGTGVGEG